MTRQLRLKRENELESKGHTGLILANGGVLTYQHAICLSSSQPRRHVYPDNQNQTTESDTRTLSPPAITDVAEGEAVIEVSKNIPSTDTIHRLRLRFQTIVMPAILTR